MENNRVKHLSIDQARQLGQLMEKVKYHKDSDVAQGAFFFLVDIKADLMDHEDYEQLTGFHQLEEWHGIRIPFKVNGRTIK